MASVNTPFLDSVTHFQERRERPSAIYLLGSVGVIERRRHPHKYPQGVNLCPTSVPPNVSEARGCPGDDDAISANELFQLFSDFQERERKRIACDLHDSIGASLTAIKLRLEMAAEHLFNDAPVMSARDLVTVAQHLGRTIDEIRRIAMNLKPAMLDDLGLVATLNWYCREIKTCYSKLDVENDIRLCEEDIPEALKTPIFRIVQEASNNTIKHSGATRLSVRIHRVRNIIRLTVEDNGKGFEIENLTMKDGSNAHFGNLNMRQRVKCSGGALRVHSVLGVGTCIQVEWPV